MRFYNTLTRNLEEFIPLDPSNIRMYVCGPTVYDRAHIGNARSAVVYDTLYRLLQHKFDKVTYVRNITDVDDKINARALELGISIQELTSSAYAQYNQDMHNLGCLDPTFEPKATECIADIIKIIQLLIENSHAYTMDGHVYFDVGSAKDYNALSGRIAEENIAGARVEVVENKRKPEDFVLWKPASEKDDVSSIFDSPWGKGRPGWHIECSAMSHRFLGPDFDIHGGGADLIFPHHTNEIAQSCSAFPGSIYAKYWVHNGFLTVGGEKMSKSLGNFLTMEHFTSKNIPGEVVRYFLLSAHYRKPLDYTEKALYDATETMNYLYRALSDTPSTDCKLPEEFVNFLEDDLNFSEAFAYMKSLAKDINKTEDVSEKTLLGSQLKVCGNFLGFLTQSPEEWFKSDTNIDETYVLDMIKKRKLAKESKDWTSADQIRKELSEKGVAIEDNKDGTTSWRISSNN